LAHHRIAEFPSIFDGNSFNSVGAIITVIGLSLFVVFFAY
jgi:hypothetical protein